MKISSNFNCNRTAFQDEAKWRFQFLDTLFRFSDIQGRLYKKVIKVNYD